MTRLPPVVNSDETSNDDQPCHADALLENANGGAT